MWQGENETHSLSFSRRKHGNESIERISIETSDWSIMYIVFLSETFFSFVLKTMISWAVKLISHTLTHPKTYKNTISFTYSKTVLQLNSMLWQKKSNRSNEQENEKRQLFFPISISEKYQNIHLSFGVSEVRTTVSAGFSLLIHKLKGLGRKRTKNRAIFGICTCKTFHFWIFLLWDRAYSCFRPPTRHKTIKIHLKTAVSHRRRPCRMEDNDA